MQLLIKTLAGNTLCLQFEELTTILNVKFKLQDLCGIPVDQQRLATNCRELSDSQLLSECAQLNLHIRLHGGKGGFGALLRGAGAKAGNKRPSSYDDCIDLSGRRIRHIKNEKKLSEWYKSEKDREKEEQEKKENN